MAGEIIRPEDLTLRPAPVASELMVVDNSVNVGAATIKAIVEAGRPAASQAEALAGTDASKAMTPLTSKQQLHALGDARFASAAQGAIAESAVQPGDLATVASTGSYNDLADKPPLGGSGFKTVAALLTDTTMGYAGSGAAVTVEAGGIVEAQGFRYEVATSGSSGHHITTAGGVKLNVRPLEDGSYNALAFGIRGDGTEQTADIDRVIRLATANSWHLRFPAGIYVCDGALRPSGGTQGSSYVTVGLNNVTIEAHVEAEFRFRNYFRGWLFWNDSAVSARGSAKVIGGRITGAANGTFYDIDNPFIYCWAGFNLDMFEVTGAATAGIYATAGVWAHRCNTVLVHRNRIYGTWGGKPTGDVLGRDNHGDGIFLARYRTASVHDNVVYNEPIPGSRELGRCGIVADLGGTAIDIYDNYVFGYDRGIHIELVGGNVAVRSNRVEGCYCGIVLWNNGLNKAEVTGNYFSNAGLTNQTGPVMDWTGPIISIGANNSNANTVIRDNVCRVSATSQPPMYLMFSNSGDIVVENNIFADASMTTPFVIEPIGAGTIGAPVLNKNQITCATVTIQGVAKAEIERNYIVANKVLFRLGPDVAGASNFIRDGDVGSVIDHSDVIRNTIEGPSGGYTALQMRGIYNLVDNIIRVKQEPAEFGGSRTFFNSSVRFTTYGDFTGNSVYVSDAAKDNPAYLTEYAAARTGWKTSGNNKYINALGTTQNIQFDGNIGVGRGRVSVMNDAVPSTGSWSVGDKCYNSNPASGKPSEWVYNGASWVGTANLV